jgi:WD40 repeat protein
VKENGRDILLLGRSDQQVTLHDIATGEQIGTLRGLQSSVDVLAVSANGRWIVCRDGLHWSLWDLVARRCVRTFEAPALLTGAAFLANGELVTLDWAGWVRRYTIEAPTLAPMIVALPRRARELAAGRVEVDAALNEATLALQAGNIDQAIAAARRARDAKGFERAPDVLEVWERIASRAQRTGIRAVWPVDRFGPVKAPSGFAIDTQRQFVATADKNGNVTIWTSGTNAVPKRYREIEFPSSELGSRAMRFSANGKLLAIGTYNRLHIVDLEGGPMRTTKEPRGYVRDVAFGGPDDSLLAALDDYGHAQIFRVSDLERIATVRGPENWATALTFADDNRLLVGDYDGHLICWDIRQAMESGFVPGEWNSDDNRQPAPKEAFIREFHKFTSAGRHSISTICVRDGRIFYGCADGAVHVLELATGKRIYSLKGHKAPVSSFDFLDEYHIVTSSFDTTLRIFDLRNRACLAVVEGHTHTIWDVVAIGPERFWTASEDDEIHLFHVDWELGDTAAK